MKTPTQRKRHLKIGQQHCEDGMNEAFVDMADFNWLTTVEGPESNIVIMLICYTCTG